jgi:hypothetical protein
LFGEQSLRNVDNLAEMQAEVHHDMIDGVETAGAITLNLPGSE